MILTASLVSGCQNLSRFNSNKPNPCFIFKPIHISEKFINSNFSYEKRMILYNNKAGQLVCEWDERELY